MDADVGAVFVTKNANAISVPAGATAVVPSVAACTSPWLLVCTFSLSMFLAFCKRKHEMSVAKASREVLRHYHPQVLDVLIVVAGLAAFGEYLTCTLRSQMGHRFPHLWVTSFFVLAGVVRYLVLTWRQGDVGRPEKVLLSDRWLWLVIGDPQKQFKAIHVAGTNGKGAVCALLDATLREKTGMRDEKRGMRIGRYTSPHLVRLNERFFLDGVPVDDAILDRLANRVRQASFAHSLNPQLSTLNSPPSSLICGSLFLAGEALVELGAYPWRTDRFDPSESPGNL